MSTKKVTKKRTAAKKAVKKDDLDFKFNIALSPEGIKTSILNHLKFSQARDTNTATKRDWWVATCMAIHDRILERFSTTMEAHYAKSTRRMYYLSLEYLMGRMLENNLVNAGLQENTAEAFKLINKELKTDLNLEELYDQEPDMGLGNGGLGRLAACFLDSLATLDLPAVGYGIYYEFGLFRQRFENNQQVERPDNWMQFGTPWSIVRPEYAIEVKFFGHVEMGVNEKGDTEAQWVNTQSVSGVPYDIPICGYTAKTVNFLRLWQSKSSEEFNLDVFNAGGYSEAVHQQAGAEVISKVLYPNDSSESGKQLRLMQQYFFVTCSLQDIVRRIKRDGDDLRKIPELAAIQLNDTHPAVAVPELMRLLIDENSISWDEAWDITRKTLAYTNHTLLPEALEKWSVPLFGKVLPRHLEIIFEINRRFLDEEVEVKWPGDGQKKAELSIIEEGEVKQIRMAFLSVIGSHSTNGVAALHTELLKTRLFPTFNELYPTRFNNKTNGITPRRFLKMCNPGLSSLIDEKIGTDWPMDLDKLRGLEKHIEDADFRKRFMDIKRANKVRLAEIIKTDCGVEVSPDAIFDVQVKRLHEYKRQHLNLLHIMTLYRRLLHNPDLDISPRVFIFGAKAAPGYWLAKRIIHAINAVGEKINNDPRIKDKIKVVFLPNYRVTVAEKIIPACDLSEQISTAGKEASGTGNMKFAVNGALTIGTLDGANVEIEEEVGSENIFIFGLTVEEVEAKKAAGYNPFDIYYENSELKAVLDWLSTGDFTPEWHDALKPIRDSLLEEGDPFLVCADYESYIEAQDRVSEAYKDKDAWARMAIINTARMGKFSSDRTISQYAKEIWKLDPIDVPVSK